MYIHLLAHTHGSRELDEASRFPADLRDAGQGCTALFIYLPEHGHGHGHRQPEWALHIHPPRSPAADQVL